MGPQLDSCGRRAEDRRAEFDHMLQWGRNLTVAEGRSTQVRYVLTQW